MLRCPLLRRPHQKINRTRNEKEVDVKQFVPTRIGQSVTIRVTLQEVKEKRFRFAVEAINDQGVKIGAGIHRRSLINMKKFTSSG